MKTLSIQQPWAWAILFAGKDIENRDWYTSVRGPILIHAGKRYDKEGHEWMEDRFGLVIPEALPLGGIVGSVSIIDCVTKSLSKWFFGKFGFALSDPKALPFFPIRGQLGFFDVQLPERIL